MQKVDIPKGRLVELYCEKYLTTFEIAEIFKVDRTTISNRLKEFGINSNIGQRKYRIIKATPLNKEQKEMIVGSVLGDGSVIISGRKKNAYFKVAHCEKQKDYLMWKKEILGGLVNVVNKQEDKRGNSVMYQFGTLSHHELNFYRNLFYENNRKIIRDELRNYLTPLGLATWFMDDGSKCNRCNYRLATDGFDKVDNYKLQQILKANFDLNAKVLEYIRNDKKYYYLALNKYNTVNMTKIIAPYIVNCMKYKLIDPQRLHAKLSKEMMI